MDGSRGPLYHAAITKDLALDAALFIGPKVPIGRVARMTLEDMEAITDTGVRTHTILGSERLDALGLQLERVAAVYGPTLEESEKREICRTAPTTRQR